MPKDSGIGAAIKRREDARFLLGSGRYSDDITFLSIERVNDYYIENNRTFTWLKPWKGDIFVFGNPFGGYSF